MYKTDNYQLIYSSLKLVEKDAVSLNQNNNKKIGVNFEFIQGKIDNSEDFILYIDNLYHENKTTINDIIIPLSYKLENVPVVVYSFNKQNPDNSFERDLIKKHRESVMILYYKNGEAVFQIDRLSNYEGLKVGETIDLLYSNAIRIYR